MILLVFGKPGSGKTYFARALSAHLKVPHLSTDNVRRAIEKRGQYDERSKEQVYQELLNQVSKLIESQDTIIIDGTFHKERNRDLFKKRAEQWKTTIEFIEIVAEEDCIRERIKKPRPDSEADFNIYLKISAQFEPMTTHHLKLHSDKMTIEEMIKETLDYLKSSTDHFEN